MELVGSQAPLWHPQAQVNTQSPHAIGPALLPSPLDAAALSLAFRLPGVLMLSAALLLRLLAAWCTYLEKREPLLQ